MTRWANANRARTERRIKRRAVYLARVQSGECRHRTAIQLGISERQARRYLNEVRYAAA